MDRCKRYLWLWAALILFATPVQASTTLWVTSLYVTNDTSISVTWDPVAGATRYECEMRMAIPANAKIIKKDAVGLVCTFTTPTPLGIYNCYVRACNDVDPCSEWTGSDGANATIKVDGQDVARPWAIMWRMPAPIIQ